MLVAQKTPKPPRGRGGARIRATAKCRGMQGWGPAEHRMAAFHFKYSMWLCDPVRAGYPWPECAAPSGRAER